MKKFTMGLFVAALALGQFAHADTFSEHRALLQKAKAAGNRTIEIGYNPASVGYKDPLFFWTNKYWPIANGMMAQTGDAISLVPENNKSTLQNIVRAQQYKWLYVHPDIAVLAQEHGYTPMLYFSRDYEAVFVVPTEGMSKTSDLKEKRIATLATTNDNRFAKYYLHTENIKGSFVDVGESGYGEVFQLLTNKKVDAIVVSRPIANDFIATSKGNFKILASAGIAPSAVLLAHVSVSNAEAKRISDSLLNLPAAAAAGTGMIFRDDEKLYLPFVKDHLRYTRAALGYVEPDYGRSIYDPKVNAYIEAHEAFTEGVVKPELAQPNP